MQLSFSIPRPRVDYLTKTRKYCKWCADNKNFNTITHKMFYLSMAFQIYGMYIISGCISKSVWHTELDTVWQQEF